MVAEAVNRGVGLGYTPALSLPTCSPQEVASNDSEPQFPHL